MLFKDFNYYIISVDFSYGGYMRKDIDQIFEEYKKRKKEIIEQNLPITGIEDAKKVYPKTKKLLKIITFLSGENIEWLKGKDVSVPSDRTVIFANTHRFKPDFEKITIVTDRPSFVIASDFRNSYGTISGWYFNTRPTIFVDPYSKEDKHYSYELMKRYLNFGLDCTIFPEAVWNLSENEIILDTFFGSVNAALETNSLIICTAIERYGKKYIINRSEPIDLSLIVKKNTDISFGKLDKNDEKQKKIINKILNDCNIAMRDCMATLLFEIWEDIAKKDGVTKRQLIPNNYWDSFVNNLTEEWPGYKMSDNDEQKFQNKFRIEQQQVERDMEKLKHNINDKNMFMIASNDRFLNYMRLKDEISEIEEIVSKRKRK